MQDVVCSALRCATLFSLWSCGGSSSARLDESGEWGRLLESPPKVRAEDFVAGIRFYIYPLPSEHHSDLIDRFTAYGQQAGSSCDFMLTPCTELEYTGRYTSHRQFGAEVIILQKLLLSPARVLDPHAADVFVVPHLVALDCRLSGYMKACIQNGFISNLFQQLKFYNPSTRSRHLFLGTGDIHSLPVVIQSQPLLFTVGPHWGDHPGHIIVPPCVVEEELQPAVYTDVEMSERNILLWMTQSPNNAIRLAAQTCWMRFDMMYPEYYREQHFGLKGRILLHVAERAGYSKEDLERAQWPSPAQMIQEMKHARFCPALPAENAAAGTKRLFDVVLAGCIPIVIAFKTLWGNGISWWRSNGAPWEWCMPFTWEIDWTRVVFEVPVESVEYDSDFIEKSLFSLSQDEIQAKRQYILQVRDKLVFDLAGGIEDAFSLLMDGLGNALPYLSFAPPIITPTIPSQVCDSTPRIGEFRQLPFKEGKEKAWSHTFGDVSCRSVHSWRRPAYLMRHQIAAKGLHNPPLIVERYELAEMFQSHGSFRASLMQVVQTSVNDEEMNQAVLSYSAFVSCSHQDFPLACHDLMQPADGQEAIEDRGQVSQDDNVGVKFCHEENLAWQCRIVTNSTCHLLPPISMAYPWIKPPKQKVWEILTWGCNVGPYFHELSNEYGAVWARLFSPSHTMQLTIYDACTHLHKLDQRNHSLLSTDTILLQHMLAMIYQQRQEQQIPDALILVSGSWAMDKFVNFQDGMLGYARPKHVISSLHMRLEELAGAELNSGHIPHVLLIRQGPNPYRTDVCGDYYATISHECPVGATLADITPEALAFPTTLLRFSSLPTWETAIASRRYGHSARSHEDSQNGFNFIFNLVMQPLRFAGDGWSVALDG